LLILEFGTDRFHRISSNFDEFVNPGMNWKGTASTLLVCGYQVDLEGIKSRVFMEVVGKGIFWINFFSFDLAGVLGASALKNALRTVIG
jgi:hypothetical protein